MTENDKLKDVLLNLNNDKYSRKDIIEALAWGEKNIDIYFPLVKELQPKYYNENSITKYPVKSFTIIQDLKLNKIT